MVAGRTDGKKDGEPASFSGALLSWPLLRKFETVVFACMFLAVPFFAMKIVSVTSILLNLKQTSADLVQDLIKVKQMSKDHSLPMRVVSRLATKSEPAAYLIQDPQRTIEEIIIPSGLTVTGTVTFTPDGTPAAPGEFVISRGNKAQKVEIDAQGMISSP